MRRHSSASVPSSPWGEMRSDPEHCCPGADAGEAPAPGEEGTAGGADASGGSPQARLLWHPAEV